MTPLHRMTLLFMSLVFLSACQPDNKGVERKPWSAKVERRSHFETFYFDRSQVHITNPHQILLRKALAKATLETPVYARLLLNIPKTRAQDSVHTERVHKISRALKRYGIAPHRVTVTYLPPHKMATQSLKKEQSLTLVIDQYEVTLPQCPGWDVMGDKTLPQGEAQFGCITERNFIQMLAEPKDLYDAQPKGNGDGPYNAGVIKQYRSASQEASNNSGSGFDVTGIQDLVNTVGGSE